MVSVWENVLFLWNMFYISAKFQWNIKPKEIHLDCRSCAVFMHECQAIKHIHPLCILLVGGPWKLPLSILSNVYTLGSLPSDIVPNAQAYRPIHHTKLSVTFLPLFLVLSLKWGNKHETSALSLQFSFVKGLFIHFYV